jgi:5-methyltetrahydropteroyltriglutamate--homocysteine methyltransferase
MTTNPDKVARAEAVGSLLQPARVLEARDAARAGSISAAELHAIEDEAVLEAIAMQESVGLDVITDGELRRQGWSLTRNFLNGLEMRKGLRSYPNSVRSQERAGSDAEYATVVAKISPKDGDQIAWEYPFLAAHSSARTKYTMAAPSYHRRYWSDTMSADAYASCEDFLVDVRDWQRTVAERLISQGCDYIQLDAPNYGSLCDPDNRAYHEQLGHDIDAQLTFDAELDSSLFDGLDVTGALHICRGNTTGAGWHSSGGYSAISERLFPALDMDVLLLEYDSDRAGDFEPLSQVRPGTVAVLGLLTTKAAALENEALLEERLAEAATIKPLAELALSTQCGFASAANAPMSVEEEQAKLQRIRDVATSVWG